MRDVMRFFCVVSLLIFVRCGVVAAAKDEFKDDPLIKDHKWQEAQEFYAKKLLDLSASGVPKSPKDLMHVVLCYDISRYFGEMSGEDASTLTAWLLSEPDFTATLLGAFGPKDSPAGAFAVLAALKKKFGEKDLLKYPGLAIAHAVVWDAKKPISEKFTACDSFGFYASNARRMMFNLAQLPYDAALFLACAEAPPDERTWALARYQRPRSIDPIYYEPVYDYDCLFGKPKKISGHDYTLPNLVKYGGICGDRAYFAANVARSCGIPAAWISGRGERGGHAWTGYIEPGKRGQYIWNLGCGRFEYDHYYVGATRDPQTMERINDYELGMRTLACSLSPDKIRTANCYVCLAGILEKAEKYAQVKDALELAIKNNRFELKAWNQITRLCQTGKLDAEYADKIMAIALKTFPDELDFCYGVFNTMIATVPKEDLSRRKRLYLQAEKFFKARPDLTVAIGRDYGDYLLEMDKKRMAFDVYHETIRSHMDDPRLVADMAIKVSEKRMEGDESKKAVQLLKALIKCSQKPPYDDAFARDSAWYRLETCLKGVYEKTGDQKAAGAVESELNKYKRR